MVLHRRTSLIPFVGSFFGTPASGEWLGTVPLADAVVWAAELQLTNARGPGSVGRLALADGLRTLSGGQITLRVDGTLAVDSSPSSDVVVENDHKIGAIRGYLKRPPTGSRLEVVVTQDGTALASLRFAPGQVISDVVDGQILPKVRSKARLGLQITTVGMEQPGAGLTVALQFSPRLSSI